MSYLESFVAGYIDAIEFTDEDMWDEDGDGYTSYSDQFYEKARQDCALFLMQAPTIKWDMHYSAGIDFWLTRNGHGTGFWSRPEEWEDDTETLTDLARSFRECYSYVGDDNLIYLQ